MPLFFVFIVLPILELAVFIQVGARIGVLWTLFWIFFTAFAGMLIVRIQGLTTLLNIRQQLAAGVLPAREMLRGVLLTLAGVLLIIPGFITDSLGALLLVPWVSAWLASYLLRHTSLIMPSYFNGREPFDAHQDNVIEGEFTRKDKQE